MIHVARAVNVLNEFRVKLLRVVLVHEEDVDGWIRTKTVGV